MRNQADIETRLQTASVVEANNRLLPKRPDIFSLTDKEARECELRAAEYLGWMRALRWVLEMTPNPEGWLE